MYLCRITFWCNVLGLLLAISSPAQDYSHLWNAVKRVQLGLDPRSEGSEESVPGTPQMGSGIPDVRVFSSTNHQDENSIAVSISNPSHLFISTNGRIPLFNPVVHQTWFFSTNGGTSWFGSEDIPPNIVDCYGDPVALFDVDGRAYYVTLGAPGGVYVVSTSDWGTTWSARSNADPLNSTKDDKEHASADLSGTYPNNIYAAWTDFNVAGAPVVITRSTNKGSIWGPRTSLAIGSNRGQGVHITTGPNGEVYVAWAHYTTTTGTAEVGIGFSKSTNGGANFSTPSTIFSINGVRITNGGISALNNTRTASFPYMDVDRSNGPRRGWIYIVTPELVNGQADIFLRHSTDGGATWSGRDQVNGPDVQTGKWQWMPSLAVDQTNGEVTITYFSMDSTGSNFMTNRYLSHSTDGGSTFTHVVISDNRFLWQARGDPNANVYYAGDYYETAAHGGKLWGTWSTKQTVVPAPPLPALMQAWVENLPGPPITVTVDQRLQGSPTSVDNIARWQTNTFVSYPAPQSFSFIVRKDEALRGAQKIISGYKYRVWNNFLNDVSNHHVFPITTETPTLTSNLLPTDPTITIKTDLLDAPGTTGGNVQFRDPWYIDSLDAVYGYNWRNRGMTDAVYRTRESTPPYGFKPDTSIVYSGSPYPYRGVFLGQEIAPGLPSYSVGAASQQIGNFTYNFLNWKVTQGSAGFQNANAAQTAVVFQSTNTTVAARMKAHLGSSNATATAPNNQRKISVGREGLSIVYASANRVWQIAYDQAAPEVPISSEASVARDPSIEIQEDSHFHIVWEEVQDTYIHSIKYQNPAGLVETIHIWTSTSDYRATPVISFGQKLIGQASPADTLPTPTDIKYLIVAWRGDGRLQIATRDLVGNPTQWNVFAVPGTNASSTNPSVAAQVYPENLISPVSTYLVWQQINRIQFWTIRPSGNGAAFDEFADISTNHSNNAAPSVTAVYRGDLNDPFHPVVAWHASGPLVDGPQTGVNDPTIVSRERVGSVWQPYKQIQHGTHSMQYATISYDRLYSRLGVFFQCASHVGFADADPSDEGKWDGNWGWNPVADLAANASSPNGTMANSVWFSLWTAGGQAPYPITFACEGCLSPGNLADTKSFAGARQGARITTDAKSANDRGRGTNMKTESPAGSLVVQPHPSSRSGAVDLSRLEFPGWEPDVLRGIISFEATPHELVTQNGNERVRFAPADTLNLFAEWLGTEGLTVPPLAQLLRSSGSVSISGFEVVTPPPASLNPVVFRLVLLNLEDGRTLKTLGEMRLKGLIALGRRDTSITPSFTLPLVQYRGRRVRVDFKIIGQQESFHPVFWETFFTPLEATTPLVPIASEGAQKPEARTVPTSYLLGQNYPNPFNPAAVIRYELPEPSHVSIKLYDVLGREVMTLLDEPKEAGYHEISFDASRLSSGIYLYKMIAGTYVAAKKAVVMK